jgi:5'-nucleotidase
MRILLTNDDGIHAAGIHALIKELHSLAEKYIAAPDRERSATGHSITVLTPSGRKKRKFPVLQQDG